MTTKQEQTLSAWFKQFDRAHQLSVSRQLAAVGLVRCLSLVFLDFRFLFFCAWDTHLDSAPTAVFQRYHIKNGTVLLGKLAHSRGVTPIGAKIQARLTYTLRASASPVIGLATACAYPTTESLLLAVALVEAYTFIGKLVL